jgi:hypothetical protein
MKGEFSAYSAEPVQGWIAPQPYQSDAWRFSRHLFQALHKRNLSCSIKYSAAIGPQGESAGGITDVFAVELTRFNGLFPA